MCVCLCALCLLVPCETIVHVWKDVEEKCVFCSGKKASIKTFSGNLLFEKCVLQSAAAAAAVVAVALF